MLSLRPRKVPGTGCQGRSETGSPCFGPAIGGRNDIVAGGRGVIAILALAAGLALAGCGSSSPPLREGPPPAPEATPPASMPDAPTSEAVPPSAEPGTGTGTGGGGSGSGGGGTGSDDSGSGGGGTSAGGGPGNGGGGTSTGGGSGSGGGGTSPPPRQQPAPPPAPPTPAPPTSTGQTQRSAPSVTDDGTSRTTLGNLLASVRGGQPDIYRVALSPGTISWSDLSCCTDLSLAAGSYDAVTVAGAPEDAVLAAKGGSG